MMSKKTIPFLLILLFAGVLIAFNSSGFNAPPDNKYQRIFQEVAEILEDAHFSPKKIDDVFSKDIFKKYLASLDPEKNILLQSDIRELKKYETRIDDELHGAPIQFFYAADQIYQKRIKEASAYYKDILKEPFNYTLDEKVIIDAEKLDYPANEAARKESWRKRLKYMSMERYDDLLDQKEQNKKTEGFVIKSDADLEKESRQKVSTIMERNFLRMNTKFKEEDRFNMLVNTITSSMDPHTTFFPPLEKRSFDEQMSGRFFGIGASLREEEGGIKIATIVAGMPAFKSGQIQVGDQVMKVGQGSEEPVDLSGYEVEEAVKLIRGKKGTEVSLTIKKSDGSIKVVNLIRDEIILDDTYARSVVINQGDKKIGFIYLPEFYADWERPNGARSAQDVAKEIMKLKEQQVDGIIMDLRNNGGGSLYDVVQIAGFFIPDGPIVQVKDREGTPNILRDRDKSVLYDGPLAVMVNEFSASASEIFAAAIQDYNRGIIVGSTSTYGKGTVQRNIGLEKEVSINQNSGSSDLGTIKLTLQKFYRINGGSTQLKGVTPNIVIPDPYEYLKYREKDNPDALPWDEIQKANYTPYNLQQYDLNTIQNASIQRIKANPSFNAVLDNQKLMEQANDKEVTLNLKKYQDEEKKMQENSKQLEELRKKQQELTINFLPQDLKRIESDTDKLERRKQWGKLLSKDIYVNETVNIVNDMIQKSAFVTNK